MVDKLPIYKPPATQQQRVPPQSTPNYESILEEDRKLQKKDRSGEPLYYTWMDVQKIYNVPVSNKESAPYQEPQPETKEETLHKLLQKRPILYDAFLETFKDLCQLDEKIRYIQCPDIQKRLEMMDILMKFTCKKDLALEPPFLLRSSADHSAIKITNRSECGRYYKWLNSSVGKEHVDGFGAKATIRVHRTTIQNKNSMVLDFGFFELPIPVFTLNELISCHFSYSEKSGYSTATLDVKTNGFSINTGKYKTYHATYVKQRVTGTLELSAKKYVFKIKRKYDTGDTVFPVFHSEISDPMAIVWQ